MSKLIRFYNDEDSYGFGTREEIVNKWSDEDWETNHEFIQWLFPLKTPSNFNPDAPLLTDQDIKIFNADEALQQRLAQSFGRFLRFLGLDIDQNFSEGESEPYIHIVKARLPPCFAEREAIWKYPNHNWLRITRVLASMKMIALGGGWDMDVPNVFFDCLSDLYNEGYGSPESFAYWQKASEGLIE